MARFPKLSGQCECLVVLNKSKYYTIKSVVHMSSVPETVLVRQKSRTVGRTGNTAAIYVPREIKEYLGKGDRITFDAVIKGNILKLVICKQLYNFDIADVHKISDQCGFKTEEFMHNRH